MNRDVTKAAFILWVLILIFEMTWFYTKIGTPTFTTEIIFIVTVIATTIAVGALGLKLFGNTNDN
nr:hypothetical protein [Lysinibacillus timonensis]